MTPAPKTIVVVGCGKLKMNHAAPARDLYTGQLFRAAREWAEANADAWCILSAKHGVIDPDTVVEPYDVRMQRGGGSHDFLRQIRHQFQAAPYSRHVQVIGKTVIKPRVIILAGADYVPALAEYNPELPLAGLGVGQRLQWFKQQRGGAAIASHQVQQLLFAA